MGEEECLPARGMGPHETLGDQLWRLHERGPGHSGEEAGRDLGREPWGVACFAAGDQDQKVLGVYSEQKDLASQLKGLVLTCDCWGSSVSFLCGP